MPSAEYWPLARQRRGHGFQPVGDILLPPLSSPDTYHGIVMRSQLEIAFARYLDELGEEWRYEPVAFGHPGMGYVPDFVVRRRDGRLVYIELKATLRQARPAAHRMRVIWESTPDAILVVAAAEGSIFLSRLPGRRWRIWVDRWAH